MPNPISTPPRLAVTFGSSFLGFATHFGFLRELLAGGRSPWPARPPARSSPGSTPRG